MQSFLRHFLPVLFSAAALACGGDEHHHDQLDAGTTVDASTGDAKASSPDGAAATSYIPFSASNMAAQQARVGIYEEIVAIRKATGFDKTKCGDIAGTPAAGTIAEAYTRNDATGGVLRDKVNGRKDDHAYNKDATIGTTMNAIITEAITKCHAGTLSAALAGQFVDKTLQWFFYASVYHELALTSAGGDTAPAKLDEAFGYYGRSTDGATSRGISGTAKKRDDNFGLTLNNTIFQLFLQGRDEVAAKNFAAVTETAKKMDQNLLAVLAYSVAREFKELPADAAPDVKLAEGKNFFNIIEPYMLKGSTAETKTDAEYIRAQIDKTTFDKAKEIDAAGIVSRIEKAFGIDVTP
ncbi:MAG: hypothetical protein HY698_10260 [Deltaproteobacteria bacterium]|nr:hypothetical protein [Deltaproteobacteria bacterium]